MRKVEIGLFLLLLGIVLAIQTYLKITFEFWPLIIIIIGIFILFFRKGKDKKNYFIAIYLILLGIYFYFNIWTNWKYSYKLWPTYIFIGAIAFYVNYFLTKVKGNLYTANLLSLISIAFYITNYSKIQLWPVILIILGLWLLISPKSSKDIFNYYSNKDQDK